MKISSHLYTLSERKKKPKVPRKNSSYVMNKFSLILSMRTKTKRMSFF